ncbi:hypothetical protein BH18ACT4_BH18ACT4_15230 [soil metagenome]
MTTSSERPVGDEGDGVVRSEEELTTSVERATGGRVRLSTAVDREKVTTEVERDVEHGDVERVTAAEGDSGQVETLPDGSISIPVFEERLVIEKRTVVRERIIVRKRVVTEHEVVEADLGRERVAVDVEGPVADRVTITEGPDP